MQENELILLGPWQIALAAGLILINGAISLLLKLGLERRLLVASIRTVVQLLLIGLVLEWIFFPGRPWYVVTALMVVMTLIAAGAAVQRTGYRYRGIWADSIVAMGASSWLIAAVALLGIIRPDKWYMPQYAIPLLGMILGTTLNGISLSLDRLGEELDTKRDQVETLLALGATRWEAAHEAIQRAVRTGMIPLINRMMIVGLVNLPGMMTGQILGGVEPFDAVMYQIVVMFLVAAGASLGACSAVLSSYLRLFSKDHQFLAERLVKRA